MALIPRLMLRCRLLMITKIIRERNNNKMGKTQVNVWTRTLLLATERKKGRGTSREAETDRQSERQFVADSVLLLSGQKC